MKVKTSITLSNEILKIIDSSLNHYGNRSAFIEKAVRVFIDRLKKDIRDEKDRYILDKNSEDLNKEAEDILSYQVKL